MLPGAEGPAEGPEDARTGASAARTPSRARALAAGLAEVQGRIAAATRAAGRAAAPRLLPVTKSIDSATTIAFVDVLRAAQPAGLAADAAVVELAENRAGALAAKAAAVAAAGRAVRWHFIGHVQRNKARRIVEVASVVHSVDSLRLAEALAAAAADEGKVLDVYVQVDFTGEAAKSGLDPEGARAVLRAVARSPHLSALGLMALGPLVERPGHTTSDVFARTAACARALEAEPEFASAWPDGRCGLSLGMSQDLELAVAAGSTLLRIGSDLFTHLADPAEGDPRA